MNKSGPSFGSATIVECSVGPNKGEQDIIHGRVNLAITSCSNDIPVIGVEHLAFRKHASPSVSAQSDNTIDATTEFGARHVNVVVLSDVVSRLLFQKEQESYEGGRACAYPVIAKGNPCIVRAGNSAAAPGRLPAVPIEAFEIIRPVAKDSRSGVSLPAQVIVAERRRDLIKFISYHFRKPFA